MEKGGTKRDLTEEMKTDQGVWGMMKIESPLLDQTMIGFPDVAWMMTEAHDVVLRKIGSLAGGRMMTGLLGVVQMMTGLPDELAMKTGVAGVTRMMTDHLDEDWTRTEEAGARLMRTEDPGVGWMRTGGHDEEVRTMSVRPGGMLTTIVPGGPWMMTGVPGGAWMMIEDLGGIPTMIDFPGEVQMTTDFPGVVQMMTGGLGETWMTIASQGGPMTIGFPEGVMIHDLAPGDHLSNQVKLWYSENQIGCFICVYKCYLKFYTS